LDLDGCARHPIIAGGAWPDYFKFNELSNGAYSFNQLDALSQKLIATGTASDQFSSLYTQFIPGARAFGLEIDRSIMGALNIDFQQAMQKIAMLAVGNYSDLTYENGQVRNRDNKLVQVSEFASSGLTSASPVISHYNLCRTILVRGAEAVGRSFGQDLTTIQQIFKRLDFNNIGYAFTGLASLQLSAGNASLLVFGLGILIVEVAEQHVANGMSITEAAISAAESRMRPILMTAIASLAGFLPLVVATTAGANSQQSLGTVIFGGLLVATVLSLGVVPPFYVLIKNLEARWFPETTPETTA
jgi:hydrophobic/amphiphilic exporter-1 (mainly G- bacteria), HAE1 family